MHSFAYGVTIATKSFVVGVIDFHTKQNHLEGGNYYGAKLLFVNCLRVEVILTLNTLTDNNVGKRCYVSLKTD